MDRREPWSDGSIGATGISYVGAAADFLASTGHPAVKAVAPLFAVWDTYSDHYYPGGLLLNRLAEMYDELMIALDQDRRDLLGKFAYFKDPSFDGPQPVDDDPEGHLVRAAVAEHQSNFRMTEFIREFRFRDDALASDPAVTPASFSPYGYCAGVGPDVAVYSVSGWYDGAGYANGGIARFLTLPNPKRHLLLGPWDHGARINGSPWRALLEPEFPLLAEVLRFFDHYLMGLPTGFDREAPVHYFAMHEERWHAAGHGLRRLGALTLFGAAAQSGRRARGPGARQLCHVVCIRHRQPHALRADRRARHAATTTPIGMGATRRSWSTPPSHCASRRRWPGTHSLPCGSRPTSPTLPSMCTWRKWKRTAAAAM